MKLKYLIVGVITASIAFASTISAFAADFPVTIKHILGETTIESKPLRVVSVGVHEQDFLYALGVAPVGVHEWWGGYPYATWPWADAARKSLDAKPEVLKSWEIDVEWVVKLNPDLIIASYSDVDEKMISILSEIAPVIASPTGYATWGAPWQEELRLIAKATGTSKKAEEIILDLDAKIAETRKQYPELEGKTAATVFFNEGQFMTYNSSDVAHRFLTSFGLVIPPEYDELANKDSQVIVSLENLELIDLDLIIVMGDKEARKKMEKLSVFNALNAVKQGRAFWVGDGVASAALSFQTPLSLEYLIENLPKAFSAAVDGDPKTKIPDLEIE